LTSLSLDDKFFCLNLLESEFIYFWRKTKNSKIKIFLRKF